MRFSFFFLAFIIVISCTKTKKTDGSKNKNIRKHIVADTIATRTNQKIQSTTKKVETLFQIEGKYQVEKNESGCRMDLNLYYKNNQLMYKLITNTRKIADSAEIELNESKNGYYITLKNIEWSENEGALNDEGEQIDREITLPQDIQGVLYKNELTIQNTGNAMNYYVKIGECDLKYIHLTKQ